MYSQRIKLDILNHNGPDLFARAGEGSVRTIYAVIMSGDESITINNPVICARIVKPDKTFVYTTATVTSEAGEPTEIRFNIPGAASQVSGIGCYDIRIQENGESNIVYTAEGRFVIDDDMITEEMLESVAEVNGLIFPDDFYTKDDNVAIIDDNVTSTEKTWSSSKIASEIESPDYTNTATGNPIELTDAADAPVVRLETEIQGSQDLHGYDKPWVGGAGKNKIPMTVSKIKSVNGLGTWTDNKYSVNNLLFTLITDNGNNIEGIAVSGNASNATYFNLCDNGDATYNTGDILNGCPSGGSGSKYGVGITGREWSYGNDVTINETTTGKVAIWVNNGIDVDLTFYPMIRASSESATYSPYSNICPITAYTEGDIEVSDGDGNTTTHTTTYPSAIYRGSEDVVNGEVTEEWKKVVFDGTEQWELTSYRIFSLAISDIKNPETVADRRTGIVSSRFPVSGGTAIWDSMDDKSMLKNDGKIFIRNTDCTTVADFKAFIVGTELAYELATHTTSSVTPTNPPIKSLSGYNHIESSTGDMEVEYIKSSAQSLVNLIEAVTR